MKVSLSTDLPDRAPADLLVVPVAGDPAASLVIAALDSRCGSRLSAAIARAEFRGTAPQELIFQAHGEPRSIEIVLRGLGAPPALGAWYEVADAAVRHATRLRAPTAAIACPPDVTPEVAHALAEGGALAGYRFDRYRSKPAPAYPDRLLLLVPRTTPELRAALKRAAVYAGATALARDLANTPAADLAPLDLARAARRLAGPRLQVRVHERAALRRLGMGGILAVGAGSEKTPCLIELAYRPAGPPERCVALVGKGITFDSGGLSLKPADAMQAQKRDMAGGAVVLGVFSALPALDLPLEVRGYIPAAENMPSGGALRPGDVLRACNGTTIEVLNTDAEGRLVLADALAFAARRRPDALIDFATLTAAVRIALGTRCAAVLGTDPGLVAALRGGAAAAHELLWELPLVDEYRRDLDSAVADIKNVGDGHAGTIVAALFLREFAGSVPWAHVDFSSTVMSDGLPCHPKGATGYGVRTALRCLALLAAAGK